jgi:hypothetical protein
LRGGRARGGFTLLEVTFSIFVLVVAVVSAIASQIAALNLIRTTREQNTAVAELTAAMEEATSLPVDLLPIAGSAFADGQPIAAFEGRILPNERVIATYPGYLAGAPVPDPLSIVMTLTWTDWAGRAATMRVATLKAR